MVPKEDQHAGNHEEKHLFCFLLMTHQTPFILPLVTSPLKALDLSGVLSEFGWGWSDVDDVGQMWMGLDIFLVGLIISALK